MLHIYSTRLFYSVTFNFLELSRFMHKRYVLLCSVKSFFVKITRANILISTKTNEWKVYIFVVVIFESGTNTPWHSLKKLKAHNHYGDFISLSEQSNILVITESLACEWIVSTSGNSTSLYLEAMLYSLHFSSVPLINKLALLFQNHSRRMHRWFRDYWYVPSCMHISQPHIIWWCCINFSDYGVIRKQGA